MFGLPGNGEKNRAPKRPGPPCGSGACGHRQAPKHKISRIATTGRFALDIVCAPEKGGGPIR